MTLTGIEALRKAQLRELRGPRKRGSRMSVNERLVQTAYELLDARLLPPRPGWCLMAVRQIIERALHLPPHQFYGRYLHGYQRAEPRVERPYWARDAQRILRDDHGFGIKYSARLPGDLIFNHELAPSREYPGHSMGHVALLIDRDTVLENTDSTRGSRIYDAMRVCSLRQWPEVHQVIRLAEL